MTERAHSPAPRRRGAYRRVVYLRTLRLRAGLTQVELARLSGVSQPNISHLELVTPISAVRETTTRQLAKALHLNDVTLLRFGPDPQDLRSLRRERRRFRAELARADAAEAAQHEGLP